MPETECIGKGKAHRPYEFGVKVSLTPTNKQAKGGRFILHAKALPGTPYDGYAVRNVIEETEALTGREFERIYVDEKMHPSPSKFSNPARSCGVHGQIRRELRRCPAIETVIGHCKTDSQLDRNFLHGRLGDQINAAKSAVGYNMRIILRGIRLLLCQIIAAIVAAMNALSALNCMYLKAQAGTPWQLFG